MLIDLDVIPPPDRPRPKRRWRRLLKPAFAATLLLTLTGGAAAPAPERVIERVTDSGGVSASAHLLTATALYTARLRTGLAGSVVEATPLVAGGPRWRVEVSAAQPALALDDAGTTLVVRPGAEGRITFVDARTGAVRWRTGEYTIARLAGDRVAYWTPVYDGDEPPVLRMADITTGRTRWQRTVPVMALDVDAAHRTVLAIDFDGTATVFAADDGHPLGPRRSLGVDPYEWELFDREDAGAEDIIGDVLYLHAQGQVLAFRLGDLEPLWRTAVADPQVLGACGALICANGSHGMTALDPVTGGVRWTSSRLRSIASDGLALDADFHTVRIDTATGRPVADLGRGAAVGDLLLRYERLRTWVVGRADGAVRGVLPLVAPSGCSTAGDLLACPTAGQTVTVWRVR